MKGIKIERFSNYWIFPELGMIWSIPRTTTRGGWIAREPDKNGYIGVTLYDDNGKPHRFLLHRLIWESVYGKIPKGKVINHKDETPSNCVLWNLEMCTQKENINYGTRTARAARKKSKQVEQCSTDGTVINVFASTKEVTKYGYSQGNVAACCRGERKTHKGFIWRYKAA